MQDKEDRPDLSRRNWLTASAAIAGIAYSVPVLGQQSSGSPPPTNSSSTGTWNQAPQSPGAATNPGPQNPPIRQENPDSWSPPRTDHGDIPNFKFPFSVAHNRRSKGGWAREVTVRDFPISTTMAGVNMRLGKGAIRELHWHLPAEWAYMLYGTARITGVDQESRAFVSDVKKGDLWYFPTGIPHSIQGLGDDGCEFLLVFDDGTFSEFSTFLITDWMAHTPRSVLAKNFNVPEATFDPIPKEELYIFPAPMPNSLEADKQAAATLGEVPEPFDFRMLDMPPTKKTKGGEVRIVDSKNFKASKTIAAALVTLHPGGLRELHWHPRADEWQYYISGKGSMTIFGSGSLARTMDFEAGDVGYIPRSNGHFIENTGNEDMVFLEMFRDSEYMDISLAEWMAHVPPETVAAHLNLPQSMIEAIAKQKQVIVPA